MRGTVRVVSYVIQYNHVVLSFLQNVVFTKLSKPLLFMRCLSVLSYSQLTEITSYYGDFFLLLSENILMFFSVFKYLLMITIELNV